MSDQTPLTPPSEPPPGFEPYQAPAYGDVAPDAPTQQAPVPPGPPGPPLAPGPSPVPGPAPYPAPLTPYPVTQSPYQIAPQYLGHGNAPTHPLATTSLVLGISGLVGLLLTPFIGFTFIAVLCSPFAIWLGARSRREIRANPRAYSGAGLATGGFVTGIVGLVLAVVGLLLLVAAVIFFISLFAGYDG